MRTINSITNEYMKLHKYIKEVINIKKWSINQVDLIIGGDFNTKMDVDKEWEPKIRQNLENWKRIKMRDLINEFDLIDSYRSNKNNYAKENINGFMFSPRRVTFGILF